MKKYLVTMMLLWGLVCLAQTEFAFPFLDSGNGVPEGWQLSRSSGQCTVQDGVVSLEGQSTGDLYLLHPVTLEKDVTYTLTCEARCQPGGDYMIYYEYWLGDKFESHIWRSKGTGQWEQFSISFAKSVAETSTERVILRLMNDSRLEVRNLRIAEESHNHGVTDSFPPSAPTIRFIHNGSFEWFEKYWNLLSDAKVVRSDDDFGNTALRLGKDGFVVQQSIHLLPKRKYRLIWYGMAAEENPGTLRLTLRYMPEKKLFHDQEYSLVPEAYQRHAVEFWTPDEADPVIDLILKNEGDQPLLLAQFYLKEFSEEETAPIRIRLSEPHYRDAIYASMPCDAIRGEVEFAGEVTSAEVSFNGESIVVTADLPHFEFSAESLTAGDHELVVSAEIEGETMVAHKVIHKFPHQPNEVTIGKDRNFYCDGMRFFPFFMGDLYEDPEMPVMSYLCAMRGMNGFFTSGMGIPAKILRELDHAQRFGLKVMLAIGGDFAETDDYEEKLREQVTEILTQKILHHPALFAYNYCDEPWAREIPAYKFEAAERIFREIDPYHPLFINESPRGVVPEYLADYAKYSDIYGVDLYPVPAAVRHSAISDKSMAAVGKYSDLYNAAADGKPVLMWLQGYQWHEDGSPLAALPDAHELQFMLLDALMHGTKAIMIYNNKTVKQSYYSDLFAVSGVASSYEPIIATGREVNSPLRADGLTARSFELPGGDTFHLLLNETDQELTVDIAALGDAKPVFTADSILDGTLLKIRPWGFASFSRQGNEPTAIPLVETNGEFEAAQGDFLTTYLREKFPQKLTAAEWIWYPGNVADNPQVSLDRELKFEKPVKSISITATADNILWLSLDDELLLESTDWFVIDELDVTDRLRREVSNLHLEAKNQGGPAAIMVLMNVTYADGTQETIGTDASWEISNGSNTMQAQSFGKVGIVRTWNWTLFEFRQQD
ncbi:MAG: hypothetical protein J5654_07650 [Victivallales bacterium]|nr:hypothetical protein [Victivallales bacterium]